MSFDVMWTAAAENELATLWLNPLLRLLVTESSGLLEERLVRNAAEEGESRSQGTRITFEPPLGMRFWVNEEARRVLVPHIWAYRQR